MREALVPVDPVLIAQTWLRAHLPTTVKIVQHRPNPVAGEVVTVQRTGGVPSTLVTDAAWLSIEVYAETTGRASDLAHYVFGLLRAMAGEVIDGTPCYRTQILGAPTYMPLTGSGDLQRPRYTFTLQVTFRMGSLPL